MYWVDEHSTMVKTKSNVYAIKNVENNTICQTETSDPFSEMWFELP